MKKIFLFSAFAALFTFVAVATPSPTAHAETDGVLTLSSPVEGEIYADSSVTISFVVEGLTIESGGDHIHYYLDDEGVVMVYATDDIVLEDLADGEHTLRVVVSDAGHSNYSEDAVSATVAFTVNTSTTETVGFDEKPEKSLAFTELADGDEYTGSVPVEVMVDGTTVGEDYDHLHVYVDGTLWDMVYETSFDITDLEEGEHMITVTLADNNHVDYTEEDLTASVTLTFYEETTFPDVGASHDNYAAIEYLVSSGALGGYSDGTFQPSKTVNRAELMKILVAGQGIDPDESLYQNCFPDVTTDWYAKYVCYAEAEGWVSGYPDGTFLPGNTVNKVEALKMIINGFGLTESLPTTVTETLFDDTDNSAWYAPYVVVAKAMGLLEVESGDYEPAGDMVRGWVSEYVFRAGVVQAMRVDAYDTDVRDAFFAEEEFSL